MRLVSQILEQKTSAAAAPAQGAHAAGSCRASDSSAKKHCDAVGTSGKARRSDSNSKLLPPLVGSKAGHAQT